MIEDTLLVIQPVSTVLPRKWVSIAGDRIVAVNDSAIAGVKLSTEDIMSRLRGPKDSEVKLTIVRRGVEDQLYFNVKRDKSSHPQSGCLLHDTTQNWLYTHQPLWSNHC